MQYDFGTMVKTLHANLLLVFFFFKSSGREFYENILEQS